MRRIRDESGAIEGLPLQLMITVIVAGLTLAVILGWVVAIQTPAVIRGANVEPHAVDLGDVPIDEPAAKTLTVKVVVYDAKNAPIKGAVVVVSGAVATPVAAQDGDDGEVDGTVTFRNLRVILPPGVSIGELTFTIQKAGYPSKIWTIPVVRGV